jgi:ATP-binding cassette, subfamily G (WHITE), eye pigment precursor transporter
MSDTDKKFSADICWKELTVTGKDAVSNTEKTILRNSNGYVKPGEFLAVLGPSGAGKTTLLNCLSNRLDNKLSLASGQIFINSCPIDQVKYSKLIGYVPQEDILFSCMTPREILDFSASLTLNIKKKERKELVDKYIEDLGLKSCADVYVGDHIYKSLSGGEKKRTSLGMELICNPYILFLDEPTTGLDSYIAINIIDVIINITKKYNTTIIATIHQPNSQIFAKFDKLLLLSNGITTYMGDAKGSIDYIIDSGFPISANYNPADHFLSILSENYLNLREYGVQDFKVEPKPMEAINIYSPSFYKVLYLLTWRACIELLRNPFNLLTRIFNLILFSLSILCVFWNLGLDFDAMLQRVRLVMFLVITITLQSHITIVIVFQSQKSVFIREYKQDRYGALEYFLSYNIVSIPIELIWDCLLLLVVYSGLSLNTDSESILKFGVVVVIAGFIGSGLGMLISIGCSSLEATSVISGLIIPPMVLVSGMIRDYDEIPDYLFFKWVSTLFYTYQAGVRAQLHNLSGDSGFGDLAIEGLSLPNSYHESIIYGVCIGIGLRIIGFLLIRLMYGPK